MTTGETRTHAGGTNRPGPVAGLPGPAVRRGLYWRPLRPGLVVEFRGAGRLWPVPGHLLHLLDLLRGGRPGGHQRNRLPLHLYRPGRRRDPGLSDAAQNGARGQAAQRHLDRRFPGLPLRQEPGRGRHRHLVRHGGRAALYRPATPGGVVLVPHHRPADSGAGGRRRTHRHLADRGRPHGRVHHPVRRPQRPCLGAAPRHDAGHRLRIGGQAAGPADGGTVRAVRAVRRAGRPDGTARPGAGRRRADHPRRLAAQLDRDLAALGNGVPLPAAPVPCRGGRARPSGEPPDGTLAVPALSRADQPLRDADRGGRAAAARAGGQSRPLRAAAAARGRPGLAVGLRLHRRPVGGDIDGDRGLHGAVGHDRQRAGHALSAAAATRLGGGGGARDGTARRVRAPGRGRAHPDRGLCL